MPDIDFGPRPGGLEPPTVAVRAVRKVTAEPAPGHRPGLRADEPPSAPGPAATAKEEAPPQPAPAAKEPEPAPGEPASQAEAEAAPRAPRTPRTPVPVLDGGFGHSDQPVSVFPAPPPAVRGADVALAAYASDVEPVSLRDLEVVLAPPPLPPAWSGSAMAPPSSAADPRAERLKKARAARAKDPSKPTFFQVDSIPPPSGEEVDVSGLLPDDAPNPISRPSDLRDLLRPSIRPKRGGLDLAELSGGLFEKAGGPRPPPPDLSLLVDAVAPVENLESGEPVAIDEPPPADEAPAQPPAPARARAEAKAAWPSPAPAIAARRAPPRASSGAGGVIAFVGAGILVAIAAFQLGARTAPPPDGVSIAAPPVPAPEATAPPPVASSPRPPPPSPRAAVPAVAQATADRPADRAAVVETTARRTAEPAPRAAPAPVAKEAPPAAARPHPQPAPAETAAPLPSPGGAPFDGGVAAAALARAAGSAAGCRQGDDPSGSARVSITFAPSGRVTSARVVGPPYQGTRTGGCIALSFGSASVPPFTGDPVTVSTDVHVR
jgi:hypothetical protein